MKTLSSLGRGVLWAIAVGAAAHFFGLYTYAMNISGLWELLVIGLAAVGIIVLFQSYPRGVALWNFELCNFALWYGHINGPMCYCSDCCIEWYCIAFLWPWLGFAVFGGLIAFAQPFSSKSPNKRTTRVALKVMIAVGVLLGFAYSHLLFFENRPVFTYRAIWSHDPQGLAYSPDGRILAVLVGWSLDEKSVRLCDAINGKEIKSFTKEGINNSYTDAALWLGGDPLTVAASSNRSSFNKPGEIIVQTWNVSSGALQRTVRWNDEISIQHPIFSHDGRYFIYTNKEQVARLYDLEKGEIGAELSRDGHDVHCLAITPADDLLACATLDLKLELWNLKDSKLIKSVDVGPRVESMAFSPDGNKLACGLKDGSVEMYDPDGTKLDQAINCFDQGEVESICFSPDGKMIACGGVNGITKLVNLEEQKIIDVYRTWGGWRTVLLAFSPDGGRLATGDANGRISVWDISSAIKPRPTSPTEQP